MINGKKYDWEGVSIALPTGVAINIKDIDYGDKKDDSAEYGKGSTPIGYSGGNYEATVKFTLGLDEAKELNSFFKQYGAFYDHEPFPIVASYANKNQPTITDELPNVKITERKNASKQGDKGLVQEFSGIVLDPIVWDGLPACK